MNWLETLAAAMPPSCIKIGKISDQPTPMVEWDLVPPMTPLWLDGFDLVLSATALADLVGMKVLLLLPEGQPPVIAGLLRGGQTDATS